MKLEIELDATDRLEQPGPERRRPWPRASPPSSPSWRPSSSPATADLEAAEALASRGTLEVLPLPSPLLLLVLGANRIVPVRITEFSIIEEAFDTQLNPIRARVSLGLRVLTIDDLPFGSQGRRAVPDRRPAARAARGPQAAPASRPSD